MVWEPKWIIFKESYHKGLKGRMSVRWENSPLEESIAKNTVGESKNFDENYSGRLWPHRNQRLKGVLPLVQFNHRKVDINDGFWDGLNKDLGSIKMKILAFNEKTIWKLILNRKRK